MADEPQVPCLENGFIDPKTGRRNSSAYYAYLKAQKAAGGSDATKARPTPTTTSSARAPAPRAPAVRAPSTRAPAPPSAPRRQPPPPQPESTTTIARAEAEALALQWKEAKSLKNYALADGIRSQLREVGIEAEDLAAELGRGGRSGGGGSSMPTMATEPSRSSSRSTMSRSQAEALAMRWRDAKSSKDYTTADSIRTQLRAVGIEAETLYQEIEFLGLSDPYFDLSDNDFGGGGSGSGQGGGGSSGGQGGNSKFQGGDSRAGGGAFRR